MSISQFGEDHGDYRVYQTDPGDFVISWKGQWLSGVYSSIERALASGREQVEGPGDEDRPPDWMTFLTKHCGLWIP